MVGRLKCTYIGGNITCIELRVNRNALWARGTSEDFSRFSEAVDRKSDYNKRVHDAIVTSLLRRNDVARRRFDVMVTLLLRHVSAGIVFQ